MIKIKSISIQGQGKRANQEDSFFPEGDSNIRNLFLVCDGIGGAEKGEVASQRVAESIGRFFKARPKKPIDEAFIQEAITEAEKAIHSFLRENPQAQGMGTTLVLLHVGDDRIIAAHIGDSRIYHFRKGTILWQSKDHSWINEMLERGLLTKEQAEDHPRQNVITRALQGNIKKGVKADVQEIVDVQKGDYFLLCSDGILESFPNDALSDMMAENTSLDEKAETMRLACSQKSKDNYTAWLIQVTDSTVPKVYDATVVEKPVNLADKAKKKVHDLFRK